jgi:hypothetical protein
MRAALMSLVAAALWLGLPVAQAQAKGGTGATFTINAGAGYTNTADVTLTLRASGATLMRFRNASSPTYSPWESYAVSRAWTLDPGDGVQTVYAQYKIGSGPRTTLTDAITLDTTGPVTTTDYDGLPARSVTVTLLPVDALSGVAATWYRVDGGTWSQGAVPTLHVGHKRSSLGAGQHTLEYYANDVLGNTGPVASCVVTLQY